MKSYHCFFSHYGAKSNTVKPRRRRFISVPLVLRSVYVPQPREGASDHHRQVSLGLNSPVLSEVWADRNSVRQPLYVTGLDTVTILNARYADNLAQQMDHL